MQQAGKKFQPKPVYKKVKTTRFYRFLSKPYGVFLLSVLTGLLIWMLDALIDYLFFYKSTDSIINILLLKPPEHEIYIRALIMLIFIAFGILLARHNVRRQKLENLLQDSKENLRITLSSIGDAVISTDLNGHVDQMNAVASQLTAWEAEDAIGNPLTTVFKIVNAFTRQPVENPVNKVLETGNIVGLANHTVLIGKDGTEYQIADSAAPILNTNGEITGVVLVFRDVSEEYEKNRQLEESEEFLKTVFRSIQDGITVLNKDMTIRYVNPVMEKWYAHKAPLIGKKCYQCYHNNAKPCTLCPTIECINTGKSEVEVIRGSEDPDSPIQWLEVNAYPLKNFKGEVTGVIEFIRNITERIQAEKRIEESNERFKLAFHTNPDAIVITRLSDGVYLDANEGFLQISGYSREEVIGKTSLELHIWLNTKDRTHIGDKVKKNETVQSFESKFRRKNGEIFIGLMSAALIHLDGEPAIISITRDITHLRKIDYELKEQKQRLQLALEGAELGVWDWNVQTGEVFFDDRWLRMLGYERNEIEPHVSSWEKLVHPEDMPEVTKKLNAHLEGETAFYKTEHRVLTKSGAWKWILDSGKILEWTENGKPLRAVGTHLDIDYRKTSEEALRESEQKYRLLAETTSDFILLHDLEGKIIYANDAFFKISGKHSDLSNASIFDFIDDEYKDKVYDRKNKRLKKNLDTFRYETMVIAGNEHRFPVDVSSSPVLRKGKIDEILIVARDISEKKKWEEELKTKNEEYQATNEELSESLERIQEMNIRLEGAKEKAEESDRLKSAFLANMSHEIRTPMNGILGFSELLKTSNLEMGKQHQYIDIIRESGKRMLNLINDLIDISKIEAGQMKVTYSETNVNEVMEYLYTFFNPEASKKGLQLFYEKPLEDNTSILLTDREKFIAIFTNLIKNAIKFTEEGKIEFGYRVKNETLEFYVSDTGMGIPAKKTKAVFERFVHADLSMTKPYEGAGLGLSISKAYVQMLGGNIRLTSEEGKGSTFFFTLPYESSAFKPEEKKVASGSMLNPVFMQQLNVLIAEDDPAGSIYLQEILKKQCNKIYMAGNGQEALEILKNHPDINLVLLDIKMPRMDGYEVAHIVRKTNKDLVIIAQTAYALSGDRKRALEAGCNEHLSKPVKKEQLFKLLHKFFG